MTNPNQVRKRRLVAWSLACVVALILVACATPVSPVATVEASSIPPDAQTHTVAPAGTDSLAQAGQDATLTPTAYFPVVTQRATVTPASRFTNIIFLHHSVGGNLMIDGNLPEKFHNLGYQFWDHGYNADGVHKPIDTAPYMESTGYDYHIPYDSTDISRVAVSGEWITPNGLYTLFQEPLYTTGVPALPAECVIPGVPDDDKAFTCLMRHDVIIFKSCFPNAEIKSDAMLEEYKTVYRSIADRAAQYPSKIFITLGYPPRNRNDGINAESAARGRAFIEWLKTSPEITGPSHPNFFVYDLFGQLAGADNFLRAEYVQNGSSDSHPNTLAGQTIAPNLVKFVDDVIKAYTAAAQ